MSRDGVDGPSLAAITVISLSRSCREDSVLQEEGLVARHALFEEVGLSGFFVASKALLMQDGVELPFRLSRDVMVEELIAVGDVFLQLNLARVYLAGESRRLLFQITLPCRSVSAIGYKKISGKFVWMTTRPH